ncbi:MAG: TlpA family protein disulfide reductase, partial [Bacteroidales bacterium]|nr:TlpA family protein disulfide reductase [Bacteroidales bacterium]
VYFDFMNMKRSFNLKFELLNPLIDYFPKEDSFYLLARNKYISIQHELANKAQQVILEYPGSFAARLIALQKPPFLDPALREEERFTYLKDHFFDEKKFNDIELIRTNAYPTLAIEYMSLFGNPNFTQDQLEEELKKAVDEILYRSLDNDIIFEFIVEYLVGGFEKYHFDKVLDHIAESYSSEQCENEEIKSDLATRLKKYAELAEGKTAPDITIPDISGNEVTLSAIPTGYTLVLFWASWCPHCNEALPEVHTLYLAQEEKKYEVLAISLDKERKEWEKALEPFDFQWIDACDLKGWDGNAARKYNIYATPTMFLLDKNLTIISKPITVHGLKVALEENGLL